MTTLSDIQDSINSGTMTGIIVEVTFPETEFGGVIVNKPSEFPIQVIIDAGAGGGSGDRPSQGQVSSVFGRQGDIVAEVGDYSTFYELKADGDIAGMSAIINGNAFVDVALIPAMANDSYLFIEARVSNLVDLNALNIWATTVVIKTVNGFRILLNGEVDSNHYKLNWVVRGRTVTPPPLATTYLLSGPASGFTGVAATFSVDLPTGTTVPSPVTVTPNDLGGGGAFSPASVTLTTDSPSATFTYTAGSGGAKTLRVTNDGGLTNPADLLYTAVSVHLLDTLISYWKFDEANGTRKDSQGSNHLAENGGVIGSAAGKINNGALFVAANSRRLAVASNPSLQVTGDFTLSLWVKLTEQVNGVVFHKASGAADYGLGYDTIGGFYFWVNTLIGANAASAPTVANGVLTHVLAWYDSATNKTNIRINDNDATTYQCSGTPALVQTAGELAFGAASGGGTYLDALEDEAGFWKRLLTATEKTALYDGVPFGSFLP